MQLTAIQQKEIEDSVWVVNTALKRQGLSCNEDLRQSAILYMCECLLRYDPKALNGPLLLIRMFIYILKELIRKSIKEHNMNVMMI